MKNKEADIQLIHIERTWILCFSAQSVFKRTFSSTLDDLLVVSKTSKLQTIVEITINLITFSFQVSSTSYFTHVPNLIYQ